jgi:hypothetical protein
VARLDFWDLMSYISESNRQAAANFGYGVFEVIERLKELPESGRIVPEFNDQDIIHSSR